MRVAARNAWLALAIACCPIRLLLAAAPVHPYERVKLAFTVAGKYANPYTDVEMWVDLKGPNFSKRCYGFWDGAQTFRVRVTSMAPGEWTWTSGSSPADAGLSGKHGSFSSVAWSEAEKQQNPNRRGFPRATANGHALEYGDGTPYFAVSDFFYSASTWRCRWRDSDEQFDVSDPEAGYKNLPQYRIRQGFNMIFIISSFPTWAYDGRPGTFQDRAGVPMRDAWPNGREDRAENMVNEENERPFFFPGKGKGYPEVGPDMFRINPSYFRYLDKKMDYAADHGVVVLLETLRRDIAPYMKAYYGGADPDMRKNATFYYLRWLFARYQAHPVVWAIYHYDCLCAPYGLEPAELRIPLDGYHQRYGHPPFGQLVSTNVSGSTYRAWGHTDKAPWLTLHQTGNSPRDHSIGDFVLEMYNLPNPLPIFGQEPWYIPNDSAEERRKSRSTMHAQLLNGGALRNGLPGDGPNPREPRGQQAVRQHVGLHHLAGGQRGPAGRQVPCGRRSANPGPGAPSRTALRFEDRRDRGVPALERHLKAPAGGLGLLPPYGRPAPFQSQFRAQRPAARPRRRPARRLVPRPVVRSAHGSMDFRRQRGPQGRCPRQDRASRLPHQGRRLGSEPAGRMSVHPTSYRILSAMIEERKWQD